MNVDAQLVDLSNVKERLSNQVDNSVLFHKQITTIEKDESPEYWYHIGPGIRGCLHSYGFNRPWC